MSQKIVKFFAVNTLNSRNSQYVKDDKNQEVYYFLFLSIKSTIRSMEPKF